MPSPLLYPLPGNEAFAGLMAQELEAPCGEVATRRFPDGETWLRVLTPCEDKPAVVVATLHQADEKLLPLLFLADTLRDMGATAVGLVTPYLGYMRQDRRFHEGEALTGRVLAGLLSGTFDWLVSVDPHLHRLLALEEIFSIPCRVVHAAPVLGRWISGQVARPLIVGPDVESEQWAAQVAAVAQAPHVTLSKTRHGDRDVTLQLPSLKDWHGHTPVLVDDIISSGHTLAQAVTGLKAAGFETPWCVGVHGVFAPGAEELLRQAGVARLCTTNTIAHPTNALDVSPLAAQAVAALLNPRR